MNNDFMLEMGLRHFDLTDEEIAKVKAIIPKVQYLVHLVKQHKTVINEVIDVADMVAARVAAKEQQ